MRSWVLLPPSSRATPSFSEVRRRSSQIFDAFINSTSILLGNRPAAMWSAAMLLGLYRIGKPQRDRLRAGIAYVPAGSLANDLWRCHPYSLHMVVTAIEFCSASWSGRVRGEFDMLTLYYTPGA